MNAAVNRRDANAKPQAANSERQVENAKPEAADAGWYAASAKRQAEGRDAQGRFVKGNGGGPGNPFARKVAQLRAALVNFVTQEEMKQIALVLKEKAMGGDLAAIKLLFQYVLGKPAATVDPDRMAIDEWQKLKESAVPPSDAEAVMQQAPAEMVCDIVQEKWPIEVERHMREAAEMQAWLEGGDEGDEDEEEEEEAGSVRRRGGVGTAPSPIGGFGGVDPGDWLRRMVEEAMASRQTERAGGNSPERGRPSTNG